MEKNEIYNLDCIKYLKNIKEKEIDCIILDPPYYNVVNEKWDKQWKKMEEYLTYIWPMTLFYTSNHTSMNLLYP